MDATAALGACGGVLFLYNAMALALRRASGLSLMLQSGRQWTQKHVSGRSAADVTLAIQTLRNTVLVATFVGTLSFTVAATTLGTASAAAEATARARALVQAALLTGSFLNFALVIRCAAHAGYLIGSVASLPSDVEEGAASRASALRLHEVTTLLHMQAVHFSLGFRFAYCSIPFAFAVAGPEALVASTCVILAFLFYIDHALYIWGCCTGSGRELLLARAIEPTTGKD
jgi:hypothetical protein